MSGESLMQLYFEQAFSKNSEVVIFISDEGRVLYMNGAAQQIPRA
jgi:PAS domain-containing protein